MIIEQKKIFPVVLAGFSLTVLFLIAEVMSGLGTKWGFWHFRTGLSIFRWSAYGEVAAVLITSAACILSAYKKERGLLIFSAIGLIIGIMAVSIPLQWMRNAQSVPPIHDITTDTENPPQFVMILDLRKDALNPPEYGGAEISSQQHAAYPDIKPLLLEIMSDKAFDLCLATAREMGWDIVKANTDAGIIEATDTTFWFGFKDDIVIRISATERGSRIDMRSVSRVGKSDVGTNAKRTRDFLKKLQHGG